jgi:hypothetical protein
MFSGKKLFGLYSFIANGEKSNSLRKTKKAKM